MYEKNSTQKAGLNTQHVLDEQHPRAGRNTQLTKSEELINELYQCIKGMLRPNNNQLYSYYMLLLIPIKYLQYL